MRSYCNLISAQTIAGKTGTNILMFPFTPIGIRHSPVSGSR